MMFDSDLYQRLGLADIQEKILTGDRLTTEDGARLLACPNTAAVGALAHHVRTRLHGKRTFFVTNRHINYTNVCINGCRFCAYNRERGQEGTFELTVAEIVAKARDSLTQPREIHIVGGCHPDLPLSYFEEALSSLKEALPKAALKCFTAVEIDHFARIEGVSTTEVLKRLQAAGLEMLPGGGAEIFAPGVREKICPKKISGDRWLEIHRQAHELGMPTNCTMLFGHLESLQDRLDHLDKLRTLQDETGGFSCFIPLPFLTENSLIKVDSPLTGLEELTTIAVSRLFLDNIPHIKAYWVMLTVKQAQAALYFGADDFDGTVVEEKIGHMAGAGSEQAMTIQEIEEAIRGCGLEPKERDAFFRGVCP